MKRTGLLIFITFCAALALACSFETRALAQESDPYALIGAPLHPSLDPPQPAPAPTRAPARPALGKPAFSARTFYWGSAACGPEQVTISVNATDPSGIASVQVYYRLASQSGNKTTGFTLLTMDHGDTGWTRTINSWDIPGYDSSTLPWWLQFYFTATDSYNVQTRSSTYGNKIMLSSCVLLP